MTRSPTVANHEAVDHEAVLENEKTAVTIHPRHLTDLTIMRRRPRLNAPYVKHSNVWQTVNVQLQELQVIDSALDRQCTVDRGVRQGPTVHAVLEASQVDEVQVQHSM